MSASSSSASSDDENYYSAAEFASPQKKDTHESNNSATSELVSSLQALNEASHEAMEYIRHCASVEPPQDGDNNDDDDDDETMDASTKNPWNNTQEIAEQLETSRIKLDQAWKNARKVHNTVYNNTQTQPNDEESNNDDDKDNENETKHYTTIDFSVPIDLDMEAAIHGTPGITPSDDQNQLQEPVASDEFRARYMDLMTETLGDELETIHQQGDDVDVDILVRCLSSGMHFLTPEERTTHDNSFFESLGYDGTNDTSMTPTDDNKVSSDNASALSIHQIKQQRLGYLVK